MDNRNFYHSFPRPRPGEKVEVLVARGLKTLAAIRDMGLVLAPEVVEWKIPLSDGSVKVIRHRQTRVCFTELSQDELPGHTKFFGPISVEFPINILRQFGALPVIYIPQMVKGDRLLSSVGPVMVWMFENMRYTLDQLDQLSKNSDPQTMLELARKTHPETTSVDPHCKLILRNQNEDNVIDQTFEVEASIVRGILNYLNYKTAPFELMRGAIHAAQTLFYPTDDKNHDTLLSYYRQREWRIIPGFVSDGTSNVRPASEAEKKFLLEYDKRFWTREIEDDRGSFRRIDEAHVIDVFQGKRISEFTSKVIVPSQAYDGATVIFGDRVEKV